MREDTFTHTEADAGRYEAMRATAYDGDRSTLADVTDPPEQPPADPGGSCGACHGAGEVSWNHSRDPAMEQSARCTWCDGSGQHRSLDS